MKIRNYQYQDLEQIIELFNNSIRNVCKNDYNQAQINVWAKTPETIDRNVWHQTFSQSNSWVVELDNKIVGFINIYNNGYLDKLYVDHKHQRCGIATLLCDQAENIPTSQVNSDVSKTALPFFTNRGYKVQSEETKIINHVPILRYKMQKKIN